MSSEAPEVDEDSESSTLQIKDPDEYNQARRLKTIHQARDEVRKAQQNVTKGKAPTTEHKATHQELAEAVATYGHELLPLMDQVGWEHEFDDGTPLPSVRKFIVSMGSTAILELEEDAPYMPSYLSMAVFAELNKFMSEVGLGVDFDDNNDEWEV